MNPCITTIDELRNEPRMLIKVGGLGWWDLAKPCGCTFWRRLKAAWLVLTGKACAVYWYDHGDVPSEAVVNSKLRNME